MWECYKERSPAQPVSALSVKQWINAGKTGHLPGVRRIVPEQRLVEIHRQMELIHADILVLPMHRCVLLLVDVDGGEPDHRVGEIGELPCVRSRRQDEGYRRGIGKAASTVFLIYR